MLEPLGGNCAVMPLFSVLAYINVSLTEPLIEYARRYAAEHDVDHFVFGHMHFPRDYREQSLHVINLGCWEKYPSCAVLDASGGMTLKMLER